MEQALLPRHTATTVTDTVLDELYRRLDGLERVVAERDRLAERLRVINEEMRS